MRNVAPALLVAVAMLVVAACATTAPTTSLPPNVTWGDHPVLTGAKLAVLHGNPSQAGPYVLRIWFPAKYQVPAHFHPGDENVTMISGTVNLGHGDKLDTAKGTKYGPGEFFRVPANMRHFAWCTEEAVIQVHGVGPVGLTWVNPADKPGRM